MGHNIIKISGKAKANWKRDDQVVINWDNYVVKYKNDRIRPTFLSPNIYKDIWNGKESDIQHVRYDGRVFEVMAKESETDFMSYLKSLDEITLTEYSQDGCTVLSEPYTVDLTTSDNFEIEFEENIGQTSLNKYVLKFRTNRTVINKGLPVLNTNSVSFEKTNKAWELNTSASLPSGVKIARLSDTSIAAFDGTYLYKYNVVNYEFIQEGNRLNIPFASIYDITTLDENSIAIIYDGQGLLEKYTFSNGNWASVGNYLNISGIVTDPVICSLSTSRVVVFGNTIGELRAYDFDGTDWAQVGSSFTLSVGATTYDICKMTSSKIAIAVASGNYLRSYDFNGSVFSLDQSFTVNSMVNISISRLSDSRVIIIDNGTDTLRSYTLSGTWSADVGSLSIAVSSSNVACEALTENNVYVLASTADGFYSYGQFDYYSDYDVLDWNKPEENIHVDWPDGSRKLARTINKNGFQILIYIETSNYDLFIERLKGADIISINSTAIGEYEFEPTEIAEGIQKIIISGVTEVIQDNKDLSPLQTYNINMNSGAIIYYSDYPVYVRNREVNKIDVVWDDGKPKTMQTIKKQTYEFVYFTNDPEDIITNVNSYDDVEYSSNVLTEIETSQEEIALNLFRVTISGVYNLDVDSIYTFPTSGGTFQIIDETPTTYTYYTDYTSEIIPIEADKNTINNQTGVNTTTKSITKTVLRLRFYIGQTNAFDIKKYCELFKPGWTCTWNSGTVYEILNSNNIEPTLLEGSPLNNAIYEVIVDILTNTTTN